MRVNCNELCMFRPQEDATCQKLPGSTPVLATAILCCCSVAPYLGYLHAVQFHHAISIASYPSLSSSLGPIYHTTQTIPPHSDLCMSATRWLPPKIYLRNPRCVRSITVPATVYLDYVRYVPHVCVSLTAKANTHTRQQSEQTCHPRTKC